MPAPPCAFLLVDSRHVEVEPSQRETLVIVTREPSDANEWRASTFDADGPIGHMTRNTIAQLAKDLCSDYPTSSLRIVDDDFVIAFTTTERFAVGVAKVEAVARENKFRHMHMRLLTMPLVMRAMALIGYSVGGVDMSALASMGRVVPYRVGFDRERIFGIVFDVEEDAPAEIRDPSGWLVAIRETGTPA